MILEEQFHAKSIMTYALKHNLTSYWFPWWQGHWNNIIDNTNTLKGILTNYYWFISRYNKLQMTNTNNNLDFTNYQTMLSNFCHSQKDSKGLDNDINNLSFSLIGTILWYVILLIYWCIFFMRTADFVLVLWYVSFYWIIFLVTLTLIGLCFMYTFLSFSLLKQLFSSSLL